MKKFLLACAMLLCVGTPAHAWSFLVTAKNMHLSSLDAGECTLQSPIRKCCTDLTATTCSEVGCQSIIPGVTAECNDGTHSVCAVREGDTGQRCCTNSTASSCISYLNSPVTKDKVCTNDGDCGTNADCTSNHVPFYCCSGSGTGSCNTYGTCAAAYPGGTELPVPKWDCDPSGNPLLYFFHKMPNSINTSTYAATCTVWWNSRARAGNGVFKIRAIALKSYASSASPSLTGGNFPTITSATSQRPYWRNQDASPSFCIEEANTSGKGSCCSGVGCLNKLVKFELTVSSSSTIAEHARIRAVYCEGA